MNATANTVMTWAARLLLAAATGLAGYLWYAGTQVESVAGCDYFTGFDCDAALASRWAKWLGVPVSALGMGAYAALLAGTVLALRARTATIGWRLVEGAAIAVLGAAVWFVGVQVFSLGSLCLYCMAAHAAGSVAAVLMLAVRMSRANSADVVAPAAMLTAAHAVVDSDEGPPPPGAPTIAGVLAIATLVGGQLFGSSPTVEATAFEAPQDLEIVGFEPSASGQPSAEPDPARPPAAATATPRTIPNDYADRYPRRDGGRREATFLNGKLTINAYEHPVIGSPEAPHLVLELMDYACPHCREFHDLLTEALERRRGEIGVIVMPVPGEVLCNRLVRRGAKQRRGACRTAKLSLAVSELAPESFEAMHRWLLDGDRIPNYTSAVLEARKYIDADTLSVKLRDEAGELSARVKRHIELYAAIASIQSKLGLPVQVIGGTVMSGGMKSTDDVLAFWDREFGLDPLTFGEPPHDAADSEPLTGG